MSSTSTGRGVQDELEHGAAVVFAGKREGLDVEWEHDSRDERGHAYALCALKTALREQHVQSLLIEADVLLPLRVGLEHPALIESLLTATHVRLVVA